MTAWTTGDLVQTLSFLKKWTNARGLFSEHGLWEWPILHYSDCGWLAKAVISTWLSDVSSWGCHLCHPLIPQNLITSATTTCSMPYSHQRTQFPVEVALNPRGLLSKSSFAGIRAKGGALLLPHSKILLPIPALFLTFLPSFLWWLLLRSARQGFYTYFYLFFRPYSLEMKYVIQHIFSFIVWQL